LNERSRADLEIARNGLGSNPVHEQVVAALPFGAQIGATDQYAEKPVLWPKLLMALFLVWWIYAFVDDTGILYQLTDGSAGKPPWSQQEKGDKKKSSRERTPTDAAKPNEPGKP
jgi:hypothetical protein